MTTDGPQLYFKSTLVQLMDAQKDSHGPVLLTNANAKSLNEVIANSINQYKENTAANRS